MSKCGPVYKGKKYGSISELKDSLIASNTIPGYSIKEAKNQSKIKQGVLELFEENPELANIGTQEQYSQYLDTIFPNSQVKDIVYHGTRNKEKFDYFNADFIGSNTFNTPKKRFYFAKDLNFAKEFSKVYPSNKEIDDTQYDDNKLKILNEKYNKLTGNVVSVLLNISALTSDNHSWLGIAPQFRNKNNITEFSVDSSEQVHILGSKQDIKKFKEFVEKLTDKNNNDKQPENISTMMKIIDKAIENGDITISCKIK